MAKDEKTTNGRTLSPVDLMARIVAGVLAHAANKDSKQESKEKRICATNLTYYINPETKETTCVLQQSNGIKRQSKVRPMEGDEYDRDTGIILATLKTVSSKDRETREAIHHTTVKVINLCEPVEQVEEPVSKPTPITPIEGTGFIVNGFHFKPTGVDGIYVLDRVAFKDKFDEDGNNDWEKSSGKKKLQEWAEKNLTKEILDQFEVDLPTVEEVFSQKMLNWWGSDSVKGLVSKQFPIFKDSDERMKEFEGKPTWWWTRSAYAGDANIVWLVSTGGSVSHNLAYYAYGFVPVLRRKSQESTNPDRKVEKVGSSKKKTKK